MPFGTFADFNSLLQKILDTSTTQARMSRLSRFWRASETKQTILDLDKELRFFVVNYLVRSASRSIIRLFIHFPL